MAMMMAPPPKSPLARYRILSPSASVRLSPLCLGAMNFGDAWKEFMGACDQKSTEDILDFFYEQGGNFIDTANNYQAQQSEQWIGEWMKKRGNRDQMVIATKYSTSFRPYYDEITINNQGNGTKSLHVSINSSLRNLQTDYIDLLYVHWWDGVTSIPEVMQALNQLVLAGKVLYLGVSDTPAWVVSKANEYARNHGLRQFSVYQGRWSAAQRDFEREIIPMAKAEGMALAPWGALGGGKFKTDEQRQNRTSGRSADVSEEDIKISRALEAVALRKNTIITSVAQAYVTHKAPYVFPIIGGRTKEQLKANIEALTLSLDEDDIKEIESALPFDPGFPSSFLFGPSMPDHPGKVWLLNMGGTTDYVAEQKPIAPRKTGE
ncbi:norsolorinic acid reductase [Annulohypoxylon truncatum]|uniref:norsolorinic acid reductase n=1 Tax=Annulohypoxylon truncatum TaxID=327061 RepID=UPI002007ECED|nr:norsolorinic acid reductase [Annulohypoxylon truncatum]KAI1208386.1 norsolorinic acid reductase [Annulohypoxylon truncatum]